MSRYISVITVSLALLVLTGCASQKPHIDYDSEANFESYERFAWAGEDQETLFTNTADSRVDSSIDNYVSPLNIRRIKSAIEEQLIVAGFYQAEQTADADFLVSFTVGLRDMFDANSYRTYPTGRWVQHWPYQGSYRSPSHSLSVAREVELHTYTEGMLAIDIYDKISGLPVWHGVERKRITGSDIKDTKAAIDKAVASILSGFPPQIDYH